VRAQRRYTRDEKLQWLRIAWVELGEPFISTAYTAWRAARIAKGDEPGPSVGAVAREFGTWTAAARLARPPEEPEHP
jgi:hypothetical protein